MEKQTHIAGYRPWTNRKLASARRHAGLPMKRLFSRFRSLSDTPVSDLEMLSERISHAMEIGQQPQISALHAAIRDELRNRESALND